MRATAQALEITPTPGVAASPEWRLPDPAPVGMVSFIIAEAAMFTIFVVAYLFYLGKSLTGPTPQDVLQPPIAWTICLLSSSLTIHLAAKRLARDQSLVFLALWFLTILLGGLFLFGTAMEWRRLIGEHGLTISTNLFGTTYYSLVGLHAFHVTVGLVMLAIVLLLGLAGRITAAHARRVDVLSLYWHFVDVVWIVVFTVVYIVGR